jgi:hypothetical protein
VIGFLITAAFCLWLCGHHLAEPALGAFAKLGGALHGPRSRYRPPALGESLYGRSLAPLDATVSLHGVRSQMFGAL